MSSFAAFLTMAVAGVVGLTNEIYITLPVTVACSILLIALAENLVALTVKDLVNVPFPKTFTPASCFLIIPLSFKTPYIVTATTPISTET